MFVAMLLLSIWYFLGQFVLSHPFSLSLSLAIVLSGLNDDYDYRVFKMNNNDHLNKKKKRYRV